MKPRIVKAALVCGLVVFAFMPLFGQQGDIQSKNAAASNIWGGAHLRMEVGDQGATLEFDCASGEITSPLPLHSTAPFRLEGTYSAQRPGPTRLGDNSTEPVVYAGTVKGDTLQLEIRRRGSDELIGSYALTKGQLGKVMRCK